MQCGGLDLESAKQSPASKACQRVGTRATLRCDPQIRHGGHGSSAGGDPTTFTVPMTGAGDAYAASIPGQPDATFVTYRVRATDNLGQASTSPARTYRTSAGAVTRIEAIQRTPAGGPGFSPFAGVTTSRRWCWSGGGRGRGRRGGSGGRGSWGGQNRNADGGGGGGGGGDGNEGGWQVSENFTREDPAMQHVGGAEIVF